MFIQPCNDEADACAVCILCYCLKKGSRALRHDNWMAANRIAFQPVRPFPTDQLAQAGTVAPLFGRAPACGCSLQAADPRPDSDVIDVVATACGVKGVGGNLIVQHHHRVSPGNATMKPVVVVDQHAAVLACVRVLNELAQRDSIWVEPGSPVSVNGDNRVAVLG